MLRAAIRELSAPIKSPPASARSCSIFDLRFVNPLRASKLEMFLGVTQKAHTRAELFRTDCNAAIGKEKGLGRLLLRLPTGVFACEVKRMVPTKRGGNDLQTVH